MFKLFKPFSMYLHQGYGDMTFLPDIDNDIIITALIHMRTFLSNGMFIDYDRTRGISK